MYTEQAIGPPEMQSIQSCKTACDAAEALLNIILNEQSETIFNCFLIALNQTNQQHISLWISNSGNVVIFCNLDSTTCGLSFIVD